MTNTGPDQNTYIIPEVAVGDTFNVWRDITNTNIYKLNKIKSYEGISSSSIDITHSAGGTFSPKLASNISQGITFAGGILFTAAVTFDGPVTFNATTFTVNANEVTIDDYNLVLGATAGVTDALINSAGGGGLILNRGSGNTAEWLWQYNQVHGITGVWRANTHIGFSGATSGLYPSNGGSLRVHGSGLQIDGGTTTDHGLLINLTTPAVNGITSERVIEFSRYASSGSTVFMEVLNGVTYGAQPFVRIRNGANRKRITQSNHGLSFGTPVYIDTTGAYIPANCASGASAEVIGIVSDRPDANNFELTYIGEIHGNFSNALLSGTQLTTGSVYYLASSAGKISLNAPSGQGSVYKALMIATGLSAATVLPFTGGLLSDDANVTTATTVGKSVIQLNKFKIGDAVRWKAGSASLSYSYEPGTGTTGATYTDGIYVKAQANTAAEAEVVGIVTDVTKYPISSILNSTDLNSRFTLTTSGYFSNGSTGVSATNGGVDGNIVAGTAYFLNSNCASTTNSFESSVPSFVDTAPIVINSVRKPLFFSTNLYSGHILSYRGDVYNAGQSAFTGYTGSLASYADLPIGSIVIGFTGSTLSPNTGATLYYHNSPAGISGEYGIYLGASTTGITMLGTWSMRGRALDRGTTGVTAYHLCQRIL